MFAIFFCLVGICIGFFFGMAAITNRVLNPMEKWWACLIASLLISFNAMLLIQNLKVFFK